MKPAWKWQMVFGWAFALVVIFIWGNEIADLPHLLLGAPQTPVNWQESIIETFFALIFGGIAYRFIHMYEARWKESLGRLEKLATFDDLTGVLNRREFLSRAGQEFSRAGRTAVPFILILMDFDNFKKVNDQYGHLVGDKVLKGFIDTVGRHIRKQDMVGRLGGDEFGVVLTAAGTEDASLIGQRIMREWMESPILSDDGRKVQASVSMGITEWRMEDGSPEDVIRRADELLYLAKDNGRNRIETG